MSEQDSSQSIELSEIITRRGLTYKSIVKALESAQMSEDQRRFIQAAWLYLSKSDDLNVNVSSYLRKYYPDDPSLQKVAEVLETHSTDQTDVDINAIRNLYVESLMHLCNIPKSQAVLSAASHFCVSEAAIWKSIKRSSTDN